MNTSTAEKRLLSDVLTKKGHKYAALRIFYWGTFESDLISITRDGYVIEYEIKTSRSDFLREFKTKESKHKSLRLGRAEPNRFFFACPEGLISREEVPDYAGLVYIRPGLVNLQVVQIKPAPFIHNEKPGK
jgi:hypothetical protein